MMKKNKELEGKIRYDNLSIPLQVAAIGGLICAVIFLAVIFFFLFVITIG